MRIILETARTHLREMDQEDYAALSQILQDPAVMYAYEHAFDDEETQQWLDRQIGRYRDDGFGLWAVVLRETGAMVGQCGITLQDVPGGRVPEIGYLFQRAFWHQGYAIETAAACKRHAFQALDAHEIYSIIRENNLPSQAVARRNGMAVRDRFVKHYHGIDMPHLIFSARREEEAP